MAEPLTPSPHGMQCRCNGANDPCELACDECDFYLLCLPDWRSSFDQAESAA